MTQHKIRLLKRVTTSRTTGRQFVNLFVQVDDGRPIWIDLSQFEKPSSRRVLLACAELVEIKTHTEVTPAADANGEVKTPKAKKAAK